MKAFVITLGLACLVSAASVDAQILGRLPGTSTNGSVIVDGSWHSVGRDRNGNNVYERRTRDGNGNILVQSAVRDQNGNMRVISTRTEVVNNGNVNRNGRNCDYTRSSNSVGDVIFGRSGNVNCTDVGNRVDGGWYPVGRGGGNNSEYVRRTTDSNGNLVIQRARRDRNGSFRIISTRYATDNDKEWNKANRDYNKAVDRNNQQDYGKHKGKGRN